MSPNAGETYVSGLTSALRKGPWKASWAPSPFSQASCSGKCSRHLSVVCSGARREKTTNCSLWPGSLNSSGRVLRDTMLAEQCTHVDRPARAAKTGWRAKGL